VERGWLVAADSTLVQVHQHGAAASRIGGNAATCQGPARGLRRRSQAAWSNYQNSAAEPGSAPVEPVVTEPDDHAIGRSRSG